MPAPRRNDENVISRTGFRSLGAAIGPSGLIVLKRRRGAGVTIEVHRRPKPGDVAKEIAMRIRTHGRMPRVAAVIIPSLLLLGCAIELPRGAGPQAQAASAATPAEHLALASEQQALAAAETAASLRHAVGAYEERRTWTLLNERRTWKSGPSIMGSHCELLALMHARAADDALAAAQRHRDMVRPAG